MVGVAEWAGPGVASVGVSGEFPVGFGFAGVVVFAEWCEVVAGGFAAG